MKILKKVKLERQNIASNGGTISVVDGMGKTLATFQVPQGEQWSFDEIIYFEMTDKRDGWDMLCVGLGGLKKEKIKT